MSAFNRQQSISRAQAIDLTSADVTLPDNNPTRAVFIGTGGTLVVELAGQKGTSITYTFVTGTRHSLVVSKFIKSGSTATGIVAEF